MNILSNEAKTYIHKIKRKAQTIKYITLAVFIFVIYYFIEKYQKRTDYKDID